MGTTISSMDRDSSKITYNGQTYTLIEYRKMLKKKREETNKKKRHSAKNNNGSNNEIFEIAIEVEKMMKQMNALQSFAAYYDNAYRQWGTIGKEILQNRHIRPHFVKYRVNLRELEALFNGIKNMSRANEKAIFQFVEKAIWKLDDINSNIKSIMRGARESGYLEAYSHHECINGKGRRLGLNTLMNKALKTTSQIEDNIRNLGKMVNDGIDPLNYIESMSYKDRVKCFAR